MADNRKYTGPADDKRVNLNQDHEVAYWTKRFGKTKDQLRKAVDAVGVMVKDIEEYFRKNP